MWEWASRPTTLMRGLILMTIAATIAVQSGRALGQNIGMLLDTRDRVHIFDADSDTILNTVTLPGSPVGRTQVDCAVTADGSLGFVSDLVLRGIWVLDLKATPPGLASGVNFIDVQTGPTDLTITPDGRFLVSGTGFNLFDPMASVDIASRSLVSHLIQQGPFGTVVGRLQSVEACDDGSMIVTQTANSAKRVAIDDEGVLSFATGLLDLPLFYINGACAPGSQTAVFSRGNDKLSPPFNGQMRSVSLPDLTNIQIVPTGGSVITVLFSRAGVQRG